MEKPKKLFNEKENKITKAKDTKIKDYREFISKVKWISWLSGGLNIWSFQVKWKILKNTLCLDNKQTLTLIKYNLHKKIRNILSHFISFRLFDVCVKQMCQTSRILKYGKQKGKHKHSMNENSEIFFLSMNMKKSRLNLIRFKNWKLLSFIIIYDTVFI